MSSNDRYRGNREYRDLTVQTHYKPSGRPTRVQTKGAFDSEMKFSKNSADARRPYEDTAFIERSRQQQKAQQRQQPQNVRAYGDYGQQQRKPASQAPSRVPSGVPSRAPSQAPVKAFRSEAREPGVRTHVKPDEATIQSHMGPKVSKEQVLQIDMVFKICIMVWAAVALVITVVLLTR